MTTAYEHADLPSLFALSGTPKEIRKSLTDLNADQVVALALKHATPKEAHIVADILASILPMVNLNRTNQEMDVIATILAAFVPKAPPAPTVIREAMMLARSRKAVLAEKDWLTGPELGKLAGFSESNLSAQPAKWKKGRQLFTIKHEGKEYFPGYGLDPDNDYRPLKAMADVLAIFGDAKDGWGLAYWFLSVNSFLGGKRPKDILTTQPERVIAAAKDELDGVAHG